MSFALGSPLWELPRNLFAAFADARRRIVVAARLVSGSVPYASIQAYGRAAAATNCAAANKSPGNEPVVDLLNSRASPRCGAIAPAPLQWTSARVP